MLCRVLQSAFPLVKTLQAGAPPPIIRRTPAFPSTQTTGCPLISSPMASSSSSSSMLKAFVVILVVLVGKSSVVAARAGPTSSMIYQFPMKAEVDNLPYRHQDQVKPVTSFRYRGLWFGFFPKQSTVPPSGPSPRHN